MKKIICLLSLLVASVVQAAVPPETLKKRMLSDLDFIQNTFEVKYAPTQWKGEYSGWNLEEEINVAKARVLSLSKPTLKEFHHIVADFFRSTRDYHVGVHFYSTEQAFLPFVMKEAQGRFFVVHVDRSCPVEVGDEVLSFNGEAIEKAIVAYQKVRYGSNTPETDRALATLTFTAREGEFGEVVPQGTVQVGVKKKRSGRSETYKLKWDYSPEQICDIAHIGTPRCTLGVGKKQVVQNLRESSLLDKYMVAAHWKKQEAFGSENVHALGVRKSFLPQLGKRLWKVDDDSPFDAYIFRHVNGQQVGFLRIPHYMCDEEEVFELAEILHLFQKHTDCLVIDQMNNPGGSVFYLYAVASMMTDRPLYAPRHRILLSQQEVDLAVSLLPYLEEVKSDYEAQELFGDTFGGYPVDYRFASLFRDFCHFLIKEWNQGHLFTTPIHLFGVDKIQPHPQVRYTKPIVLLTNPLDFSGGDFFPAILQDNKRAVIVGTRTAGAGGYVYPVRFPNQTGISGFHLTGSLAERVDHTPIENLGVQPDIPCEITLRDVTEGHIDLAETVLDVVGMVR